METDTQLNASDKINENAAFCYIFPNSTGHVWNINRSKLTGGSQWRISLRQFATSRKVAGSIPDGVIGIFHWHNPSGYVVDSAYNRNEYQEYSLEGKSGRYV